VGFADGIHRDGEFGRDALCTSAREQAVRLIDAVIGAARRDALAQEGRALKPDDAAALALADADTTSPG
jgi:hypothetical protein